MEKVIFFTPCFYKPGDSRSTGGTISNYHLFKELSNKYNVTIVTTESSDDFDFPVHIVTNPHTKNVYSSSMIARLKRLFRFFWFRAIARELKGNEYTFAFFTNGAIISCFKWYSNSRKIILTRAFEDFYAGQVKNSLVKKIILKLMRSKTKRCYMAADSIITNSKFMKNRIISEFTLGSEKISVLYPPIHSPVEQGFDIGETSSITVGMINPAKIKGEDIFIKLAENYKDIEFFYFSRSDKKYLQSNISYKGWASDTGSIFKEIDILLVPSQWEEPFGRVAAEGILYGKPVLVSNRGGLPEIVHESFIADYSNPESWIVNLNRLIQDREFAKIAWNESYLNCKAFLPENHNVILNEILDRTKQMS